MMPLENKNIPLAVTGLTRWLIVVSVMLVAIIEVLDMTIVNVALSPMMGALGATQDQITWVLTSYIVSAAIVMPLTGYLVEVVGRKRLLLINIIGFMGASLLCGLSHSLTQIVVFRILQGIFGASLIPLSQYILLDTFLPEERGKAMAIWGIGIMVGPILGPTLGGYITDTANWRWIFFINLPVCILAFFMALQVIIETPRIHKTTDWVGLFWMVLGVGCLQLFLDRGQTEDWFESKFIILMAILSVFALTLFIIRGLKVSHNIINLKLFLDYNFSTGCFVMVIFSMGVFSLIALQPLMVQQLMDYPAKIAGLSMAPRGLSSALAMLFIARYISVVDPRLFIASGLLVSALTSYAMSHFTLQTSFNMITMVSLIQGFGIGLFFVPLSTSVFATLDSSKQAEAAGLFNFGRNLGTSIGISITSTLLARYTQLNWGYLSAHFSIENPNFQWFLQQHHWTVQDPKALAYLSRELARQSSMLAFINIYWLLAVSFLFAIPFVFLLKKTTVHKAELGE